MLSNKSLKKAFTLVELIIVIAIIAILAVTAFLLLTKWLSKARDSSRASNLANIEKSLQISLTDKSSLPKPDSYTLIYASGTSNVIGYQGFFGDGAKDAVGNINSAPKDGDDYFTYYLNADLNKYQLAGFLENTTAYNPNVVNAVDYSGRFVTVKGDRLGLLTDVSKSPLQTLGLTGLNILSGDRTYIAYYDNSTNLSLSGQNLISMLSLGNKNAAQYDTGLVGYWDMETTMTSGGLLMLKDLSQYGNNGTCYNSGTALNCGSIGPKFVQGKIGKAMQFDGVDDFILVSNSDSLNIDLSSKNVTMVAIVKSSNYNDKSHIVTKLGSYTFRLLSNGIVRFADSMLVGKSSDRTVTENQYFMISSIKTFSPMDIKLYINGDIDTNNVFNGTWGGTTNNNPIKIGGNTSTSFNGILDEVRIYNRALSDDEIKALYTATN